MLTIREQCIVVSAELSTRNFSATHAREIDTHTLTPFLPPPDFNDGVFEERTRHLYSPCIPLVQLLQRREIHRRPNALKVRHPLIAKQHH
jgi:hypothetical protein